MANFSFLDSIYQSRQESQVHYLVDLHREPEGWQEEKLERSG